ncbi:hypothetical protein AFCA_011765 [Aspergillus flavus]|nr:hypothetical protein AFCA_011765 [Aspergillus flavus]
MDSVLRYVFLLLAMTSFYMMYISLFNNGFFNLLSHQLATRALPGESDIALLSEYTGLKAFDGILERGMVGIWMIVVVHICRIRSFTRGMVITLITAQQEPTSYGNIFHIQPRSSRVDDYELYLSLGDNFTASASYDFPSFQATTFVASKIQSLTQSSNLWYLCPYGATFPLLNQPAQGLGALEAGLFTFLQWDYGIAAVAAMVWSTDRYIQECHRAELEIDKFRLILRLLGWILIDGPSATAVRLIWESEGPSYLQNANRGVKSKTT